MYIHLFNPRINPTREVLSPGPFHRWGNKGTDRVSSFPRIIHLGKSTAGSHSGTLALKLTPLISVPCGPPGPTNNFAQQLCQGVSTSSPSSKSHALQKKESGEGQAQALQRRAGRSHLCPAWGWEVGVREGIIEEAEFGLDLEEQADYQKAGMGMRVGHCQIQKTC